MLYNADLPLSIIYLQYCTYHHNKSIVSIFQNQYHKIIYWAKVTQKRETSIAAPRSAHHTSDSCD
nr:unnamed protein product [Callosobruchus analis]